MTVNKKTRPLHTGWSVRAGRGPVPLDIAGRDIPATVPGVVHLDLMTAGLIPDPYLDDNESLLAWIGLVDWSYETVIDMDPDERMGSRRHELVFEGLDTVASIELNGTPIAEVANQHRSHRIDVTEQLRDGPNRLVVAFRSPIRYADAQSLELGARPRPYPMPFEAIRKSACSFGWDWGIATFTSGIWRPVRLESWSTARVDHVDIRTGVIGENGHVDATVQVDRETDIPLMVTLTIGGMQVESVLKAGESSTSLRVELLQVNRWWPAGHGPQNLYDVQVQLGAEGAVLDEVTRQVGFRDLRWDTLPDSDGTPFQLVVNGRPIFVKGANWIPDDAFPSRVDRERYRSRLTQAKDAGLNLIRVWGGGIYESDDFYELCDELGLLTWQDFLFACAAYPEEEPLRSEIEAEARQNIARLAHHASLALLTGNNENLWGYEDWGWQLRLDGRTWGAYYYHELFPRLIDEIAPHVPYAPGSPFSPGGQTPNAEQHGTMHIWDLWNEKDWPHFRDYTPRFVAEFGWQGPPTWSTLTRSISDDPLTPESPGMIVHQKATEGNAKLATGLVRHYRVPDDMESWHWAMQLNQANAVSCALDHFRSHAPLTSGAVVWQLNDCWPVTSWAAIDGDGHAKPLLHAISNAFAPRVVSVQPRDDGLSVVLGNDTDAEWVGELSLTRRGFDGEILETRDIGVAVAPRASESIPIPAAIARPERGPAELIVAIVGEIRGLWFFTEPRDSELSAPDLDATVAREGDDVCVDITSAGLVRDLTLLVDKVSPNASVDRGLVTLLAGETARFRITGVPQLSAEQILHPRVARSGNQLVVS